MVQISPVQKITALCKYLPEKDKFYADAFIIRRDFTSLRDLVDSAIRKVEKNLTKENPKPDLLNIDIDKLRKMLTIIDDYLILLGEDLEEFDADEDFNEEIENIEEIEDGEYY
jgi:hypothetical protein